METDGYRRIAGYPAEADGIAAARELLEYGIGADLREGQGEANLLTGTSSEHALFVLENDVGRACEILGVEEPEPVVEVEAPAALGTAAVTSAAAGGQDGEKIHSYFGGRLVLSGKQLTSVLLIYAVAMVLIPFGAYLATRAILDDEVEEPDITVPGVVDHERINERLERLGED